MVIKRLKRFPKVLKNGHKYYQWWQLTNKEKMDNIHLFQTVVNFCRLNLHKTVTFEQMNRAGLSHIYHFMIDEYNNKCPDYPLILTDNGVYCEGNCEENNTRKINNEKGIQ